MRLDSHLGTKVILSSWILDPFVNTIYTVPISLDQIICSSKVVKT